jgi:hypothetical protein
MDERELSLSNDDTFVVEQETAEYIEHLVKHTPVPESEGEVEAKVEEGKASVAADKEESGASFIMTLPSEQSFLMETKPLAGMDDLPEWPETRRPARSAGRNVVVAEAVDEVEVASESSSFYY